MIDTLRLVRETRVWAAPHDVWLSREDSIEHHSIKPPTYKSHAVLPIDAGHGVSLVVQAL